MRGAGELQVVEEEEEEVTLTTSALALLADSSLSRHHLVRRLVSKLEAPDVAG